jgi:hypothetical protein
MITLFSCPKAFKGQFETIQRNAIQSWTLLRPRPAIVLLGNDDGTAAICKEMGLQHVPTVDQDESGTPLVNSMFDRVQRATHSGSLCYINADIVLFQDFSDAVIEASVWKPRVLMVGCRTDLDLTAPCDFSAPDWDLRLRSLAEQNGMLMTTGVDYFVFPRGLFEGMPSFAVGRTTFDNWLLWYARSRGVPVLDATARVLAIHQVHTTAQGWSELLKTPAVKRNQRLASYWQRSFVPADATHSLTRNGVTSRGFQPTLNRCKVVQAFAIASARSVSRRLLRGNPSRHVRVD